jgi:hypothetical protein
MRKTDHRRLGDARVLVQHGLHPTRSHRFTAWRWFRLVTSSRMTVLALIAEVNQDSQPPDNPAETDCEERHKVRQICQRNGRRRICGQGGFSNLVNLE